MVQLPDNFIAIRFEGYFLNIDNMCLYSLKKTGTLRELKHQSTSMFRQNSGYNISQKGNSHPVTDDYLYNLKKYHLNSQKPGIISVTHNYPKRRGVR